MPFFEIKKPASACKKIIFPKMIKSCLCSQWNENKKKILKWNCVAEFLLEFFASKNLNVSHFIIWTMRSRKVFFGYNGSYCYSVPISSGLLKTISIHSQFIKTNLPGVVKLDRFPNTLPIVWTINNEHIDLNLVRI